MTDGTELPGAELEVKSASDGATIHKWISGDEPYLFEALEPGEYILTEHAAPEGFLIASEIQFTVESTGEIQKVVMEDERSATYVPKTGVNSGNRNLLFVGVSVISLIAVLFCIFILRRKRLY